MRYLRTIEKSFSVTSVSGKEVLCLCPWHADHSPGHLYINAISGAFICFSCHTKGSLERMQDLTIPQVQTNDIREKLRAMQDRRKPPTFYPEGWLKQFDVPHPYWTDVRGLPPDVVQKFGLGYDPFSDRVTLPLRDMHGRVLGVTYRRLDDGRPKYLHPKGFPVGKHLYGAWLLTTQRKVGLVEGQVDAVRCWSERVPALGLMGSRLTVDQATVLKRLGVQTVVIMTDNDGAGMDAVPSIYKALRGSGIRVLAGWYRPYWRVKDPDSLTGPRLRKMFHGGLDILDWIATTGYRA